MGAGMDAARIVVQVSVIGSSGEVAGVATTTYAYGGDEIVIAISTTIGMVGAAGKYFSAALCVLGVNGRLSTQRSQRYAEAAENFVN